MVIANPSTATNSPKLIDSLGKVAIVAYKESTDLLQQYFTESGFDCQVIRQQHKPEYKNYSQSYLVLLNHCAAWEIARQATKPTLIVEADFVPVINFSQLPLTFSPQQPNVGISWLYTCAPQVYSVSADGYAQGFSTSMVAYIITPQGANHLLDLADAIAKNPGPTVYSSWDSQIEGFLRQKKLKNYLPFRNYGEHGGLPNREHHQHGLSKSHRADVLYGKLAFLPMYAANSRLNFILIRLKARIKGIARLFLGKFLRIAVIKGSSVPGRLIKFALNRQLTLSL
ncbi:MAG: LPS biosynthesis glycosyltransferase [Xenococcaceae cyanobacterium]